MEVEYFLLLIPTTEYFHRNIAGPKVSDWKHGYRNFEDEKEMSREIVKQINLTVGENDTLYHLGDWSFGGINNIWNFRKQINCKNIHLILGNHDHHIAASSIIRNCTLKYIDYMDNCLKDINTSIFDYIIDEPSPNVRDTPFARQLFSSVQHVKTVKHGSHTFFLSHYAHRVWDKSHRGAIHLYGHSHATIDDNWGKSMDVGIDNYYRLFGEYKPFSLEQIINIMDKREVKILDHHNLNTNE